MRFLRATRLVVCCRKEADAQRFRSEMEERLNQYGLEIAPEKTKVIVFGPTAQRQAAEDGKRKAETFDFLGFTHYCTVNRTGKIFRVGRKSISKRITAKLKLYKEWLRHNRTLPVEDIMNKTASKLLGHYAYYGVTGNSKSIAMFAYEISRLLFKWLGRRGKRGSLTYEKFKFLLRRFPLPAPRIMVKLC